MQNLTTYFVILLSLFVQHTALFAQEIDFGTYSSAYSISLTELNPSVDLNFGIVVQDEGLVEVDIFNAKVFSIEGVRYLDVILDVTADDFLLLNGDTNCLSDPTCRIPFTVQASYANRGANNVGQAVIMNKVGNVASAQFPIRARTTAAPGPPPTPVYQGYNPAVFNETAFLYVYGSINVGTLDAGTYTGNITISVSYD